MGGLGRKARRRDLLEAFAAIERAVELHPEVAEVERGVDVAVAGVRQDDRDWMSQK